MRKLLDGDSERVRILCEHCGSMIARVLRTKDRELILAKQWQTWRWGDLGQPPKAVHEWERMEMREELMGAILRGEAGARNSFMVAHCDCKRAGEVKVSIDYRSLAPYLAAAERSGGYVKWRLQAEDGELARIWNRYSTTEMIPKDDRRTMIRRMRDLDPSALGPRVGLDVVRQLKDPDLTAEQRAAILAEARRVSAAPDHGRAPTVRPNPRVQAQR